MPDFDAFIHEPFCGKINKLFWRGSAWPTQRCPDHFARYGGPKSYLESNRAQISRVSQDHPELLDAGFTNFDQDWGNAHFAEHFKLVPSVPIAEQFRYQFLITAAPACSYTGRVAQFLSSSSVVVKFADLYEFAAQSLYAGLQDGVHLLHIYGKDPHWRQGAGLLEQLRHIQQGWRFFEGLSVNGQAYSAWAHSPEVILCYALELLAGYQGKLNYEMPAGTLARVIGLFQSGKPVDGELGGDAVSISYAGFEWHMEVFDAKQPADGRSAREASERQCRNVKASRPQVRTFNMTSCRWE